MVLPQVGAGTYMAAVTLLGALLGTLLYGLLHDNVMESLFGNSRIVLRTRFDCHYKTQINCALSVHDFVPIGGSTTTKYAVCAGALGVIVLVTVSQLESLVPWVDEAYRPGTVGNYAADINTDFYRQFAWSPTTCGKC